MFRVRLLSFALLIASAATALANPSVAYLSSDSSFGPWGGDAYRGDFDAVFGAGNWSESTYFQNDASLFDNSLTSVLVLEGSDYMAEDMANYLTAHAAALQSFVTNGGHLVINAAPNVGGDISIFGGQFGLKFGDYYRDNARVVQENHPITSGPFGEITDLTGTAASHAILNDPSHLFTPVLTTENGETSLGVATYGAGRIILGGLTTPFSEANGGGGITGDWQGLNRNILAYAGSGAHTQAVPEPASLAALGLGVFGLIRRRRAAK